MEHNEHVVSSIRELVILGQVQKGVSIFLETVPIPFLKETPLVDGEWLDRKVLELAEMGAMLQTRGYQLREDENQHCLATVKYVDNDSKEADQTEIRMFRRQAVRHLHKFSGRIKKIDGRIYIHFVDYQDWKGRIVKGDLQE